MRVYFDYNATTPLAPEVIEAVARATRDTFGNASSVHHFGQQAKAAMDDARSAVAVLINADPSEIVFTSGGTESDNFAIRGAAEALEPTGRRHLIASAIEHEAVLNTLKALARRGWRTTLLRVDESGIVAPDRLREGGRRVVVKVDTHSESFIVALPLTLGNKRTRQAFARPIYSRGPSVQVRPPADILAPWKDRRRITCGNAMKRYGLRAVDNQWLHRSRPRRFRQRLPVLGPRRDNLWRRIS